MNFNFKNISNFVGSSSSFDDDEHIKIINSIENEEKAIHIAMSNKKKSTYSQSTRQFGYSKWFSSRVFFLFTVIERVHIFNYSIIIFGDSNFQRPICLGKDIICHNHYSFVLLMPLNVMTTTSYKGDI